MPPKTTTLTGLNGPVSQMTPFSNYDDACRVYTAQQNHHELVIARRKSDVITGTARVRDLYVISNCSNSQLHNKVQGETVYYCAPDAGNAAGIGSGCVRLFFEFKPVPGVYGLDLVKRVFERYMNKKQFVRVGHAGVKYSVMQHIMNYLLQVEWTDFEEDKLSWVAYVSGDEVLAVLCTPTANYLYSEVLKYAKNYFLPALLTRPEHHGRIPIRGQSYPRHFDFAVEWDAASKEFTYTAFSDLTAENQQRLLHSSDIVAAPTRYTWIDNSFRPATDVRPAKVRKIEVGPEGTESKFSKFYDLASESIARLLFLLTIPASDGKREVDVFNVGYRVNIPTCKWCVIAGDRHEDESLTFDMREDGVFFHCDHPECVAVLNGPFRARSGQRMPWPDGFRQPPWIRWDPSELEWIAGRNGTDARQSGTTSDVIVAEVQQTLDEDQAAHHAGAMQDLADIADFVGGMDGF